MDTRRTNDAPEPSSRIRVGVRTPLPFLQTDPVLICHTPHLRRHLDRAWLRAYIKRQLGQLLHATPDDGEAAVTEWHLAHHTLIVGGSGGGKSRLNAYLLVEQIKRDCSVVVLDPKAETITHLLAHGLEAGLSPEQVVLLDPRQPGAVPGWNPLATGLPVSEAVGDIVALLVQMNKSWGPRLQDLLTNALIVIACYGLSLFELARFLQRDDYREGLLRQPCEAVDADAYAEAREYFLNEYGAWNRSTRTEAAGPVSNKIREFLRNSFLRSLLCARRVTLDLARLWHRPGLVLVHLDRATLGDEGVRLLAGLVANSLFRTALRSSGPVPVVLSMDELATLEGFVGTAVTDIVTFARSLGLRLQVACQHLAQLSDSLRSALLGNTVVQAYFRLGPDDARFVGGVITEGAEARLSRLVVGLDRQDRRTGVPAPTVWRHVIRDGEGRPLRVRPDRWSEFREEDAFGNDPVGMLRRWAAAAGYQRLYVHAADSEEPVALDRYLQGLAVTDYWIDGPSPLELVVTFPRPRLSSPEWWTATDAAHTWSRCLQALPTQHMALRVAGQPAGIVRVTDVPDPEFGPRQEAYEAAVIAAAGQTPEETRADRQWRTDQVEYVATGRRRGGEPVDLSGAPPHTDSAPRPDGLFQSPAGEREGDDDGSMA